MPPMKRCSRAWRKELHRLVARTIDEIFPDMKQAHPEVLARPWIEAGEIEPTIAEWSRAAKATQERNAFAEAYENYQQALVLLELLPESPKRDVRLVVSMIRGWSAPETMNMIERVTALAEKSGNVASLRRSLALRGVGAWMRAIIRAPPHSRTNRSNLLCARVTRPTSQGVIVFR
jgi:hypothetical protein